MTPKPKAEAAAELELARVRYERSRAMTERRLAELRAIAMANSWLVLGLGHPEAWGPRELDRRLRPDHPARSRSGAGLQLVRWGLEHPERMRAILGYDPLNPNGNEPGGAAGITQDPAAPSANREA